MTATEQPEIAELQTAVGRIRSTLGRIIYLASLRDRRTGIYQHTLLKHTPCDVANLAALQAHSEAFNAWLNMTSQQQLVDFRTMVDDLAPEHDFSTLKNLWEAQPLADMVPPGSAPVQSSLFLSEALLVIALGTARQGAPR